eukprot:TRINITY_DN13657_c0_g1_i1.p2 TRINITY_DN13657_c0_g1~~TRINITY_DN13657_c0_g1_i1.p2  ORF type:complete len:103 (+),score=1.83 TRINITY_DN13657_c0_g1_i1:358-666(+)
MEVEVHSCSTCDRHTLPLLSHCTASNERSTNGAERVVHTQPHSLSQCLILSAPANKIQLMVMCLKSAHTVLDFWLFFPTKRAFMPMEQAVYVEFVCIEVPCF